MGGCRGFEVFTGIFLPDFNVVGSSLQMPNGALMEKTRLPRFSLALGIQRCYEVDDLSCLGMLEKCCATGLSVLGSHEHRNVEPCAVFAEFDCSKQEAR